MSPAARPAARRGPMAGESSGPGPLTASEMEGGRLLFHPDRVPEPGARIFDPGFWRSEGRVVRTHRGRGTVYVVEAGDEEWVLRHLRRGGLPGSFIRDRYLWTGWERSRPFRELRLLARLEGEGLPVPGPVAGAVWRRGLTYRGDILTLRVPGQPLARMLEEGVAEPGDWHRIGSTLIRFHRAGVDHADLSAGNILVHETAIHLIDFDRGRIRSPGNWADRNLDRIRRSAAKILGRDRWDAAEWVRCWEALTEGYRAG
jgi:3-deoxy-D-manno-octulosonic acid kinase